MSVVSFVACEPPAIKRNVLNACFWDTTNPLHRILEPQSAMTLGNTTVNTCLDFLTYMKTDVGTECRTKKCYVMQFS